MTTSAGTVRRAAAGAILSCVAVLAAACGSAASPAAAPTTTVTVTVTPAGPASSPATSPAGSTAPASPAGCPTHDLAVTVGVSQGAAGSTFATLDFTNVGNATCTLFGYPGVSLAGGKPVRRIGRAAAESNTAPRRLVTLAPGEVASALLRIVNAGNYPAARCHPARTTFLQIYPPNQTTPIYLAYKSTACAKPIRLLTIGVVRPGAGSTS